MRIKHRMALIALSLGLASFHYPETCESKLKTPLEESHFTQTIKHKNHAPEKNVHITRKTVKSYPSFELESSAEQEEKDPSEVVKQAGCIIEALSSRLDAEPNDPISYLDVHWVVDNYETDEGNKCPKIADILAQIKNDPTSPYSHEALALLLDNYDMLYFYLGANIFEKDDSPLLVALRLAQQNLEYEGMVREFLGKRFEEPKRYIPNQLIRLLKAQFIKKDPQTKIFLTKMMDELKLDETFRLQWDENGCEASFLENEESGICLNLLAQNDG